MSLKRLGDPSVISDAVIHNNIVYLAGQVPADASLDITGQTADVLAQIDALLARGGPGLRLVTAHSLTEITRARRADALPFIILASATLDVDLLAAQLAPPGCDLSQNIVEVSGRQYPIATRWPAHPGQRTGPRSAACRAAALR